MAYETTVGAVPTWQPLGTTDFGAVGIATVVVVAVALLLLHVGWNEQWPPYSAASPLLIIYASLAVRSRRTNNI